METKTDWRRYRLRHRSRREGGNECLGRTPWLRLVRGKQQADGWAGTTANASEPPVWSRWSWQRSEKGRKAGGQEDKRAK